MASLAQLTTTRRDAVVVFFGNRIGFGYRPEVITTEWIEQVEAFKQRAEAGGMSEDEARRGIAQFVLDLLTDWDVTEDLDGAIPAPLTLENVMATAIECQGEILMAAVRNYTAKNRAGMTRATSRKRLRRTS